MEPATLENVPMNPPGKYRLFLLLAAAVLLCVLGGLLLPKPVRETLPNPNGYDDIIAASKMIKGKIVDLDAPTEELRTFVTNNQDALARARLGLARPCQAPSDYSKDGQQRHMNDLRAIKDLCQSFCLEGNWAAAEERPADAVSSYLNAMKVGGALAHGGVIFDSLVAIAYESMGEARLRNVIENLDARQCLDLIRQLDEYETNRVPFAQIILQERKRFRAQFQTPQGIQSYLGSVIDNHSLYPGKTLEPRVAALYDARLQWARQLQAQAAARAFWLEKGRFPTNWNETVPVYLKQVPDAPFPPSDTNRLKFNETKTR